MTYKLDWIPFYEELASKLLEYKDKRSELFEIMKNLVPKHPKLEYLHFERDDWWGDRDYCIDPFSIFGTFNRNLSNKNRIEIAKILAEQFDVKSTIPTNFEGVPILNAMLSFYTGTVAIWDLFEQAMALEQNELISNKFADAFQKVFSEKGNGLAMITMGLFWIRPNTYLNLDSRNRMFLENNIDFLPVTSIIEKFNKGGIPNGEQYKKMCIECKKILCQNNFEYKTLPELSYYVWVNRDKTTTAKPPSKKHYWLYSPGEQARLWDEFYQDKIMCIRWDSLGNLEEYSSREEIINTMRNMSGEEKSFKNDSLASWQFANIMSIGDVVIVKRGYSTVLGRGVVISEYTYNETRNEYKHTRKIDWTHKGEWEHPGQAVQKTLTDITQDTEYVEKLEMLFSDGEIIDIEEAIVYPPYTKEIFLSEVYMSSENYETLVTLLRRKKNIILQGAPGVGKTYAAKRLAYSIMNERDTSRVDMIQFHQSYAYEDFIMGYRPTESGFELNKGVFYKFCKKAQEDTEKDYFFIIDEINRGNLSKIFGELFMLIEHDKRDENNQIRLLYRNEQFYIPSNIHIIGMMNTADRSLAMLDYALRRRFAFFEMEPAFDSDGFKKYQENIANLKFNKLIDTIKQVNNVIKEDVSLGAGFRIGHSYFIKVNEDVIDDIWLDTVVNYEVIPLLQEYWFDEVSKVNEWSNKLRGTIV